MPSLATFSLADMAECAAELRKLGTGAASSEDVAQRVAGFLYSQLGDARTGERDCALVRCFLTRPYRTLDPLSQACARQVLGRAPRSSEVKCLTLAGTAGLRPEWNDREHSRRYRAIPLISAQFIAQFPMFSQLLQQLGVALESASHVESDLLVDWVEQTFNVFHVPEAKGNPAVPVQASFVIPYGIESVLGFGGVLPSKTLFMVILFSRQHVSRETAELFKPLALSVKLALSPFEEGGVQRAILRTGPTASGWQSRAEALEHLLMVHEHTVAHHGALLKRAEEELRDREEQFRQIFEEAPVGMAILDDRRRLMRVNQAYCRLVGYEETELIGQGYDLFTHPQDLPANVALTDEFYRGERTGYRLEKRYIRKDGDVVWVAVNATEFMLSAQRRRVVLAIVEDITDRKWAEEELRQSQALITSVVENLPNMIFVKDADDLKFVRFNKAGEALLGYSREELIGKNDYDFFPKSEADFFTSKDREVLASGRLLDIPEEPIDTRGQGRRYLHTKKIPISDEEGRPRYLLGISEDITERKEAEAALKAHEEQLRGTLAQVRTLTGRLATVQEEERTRIARELHDELGVGLTCLKIDLTRLQATLRDATGARARKKAEDKIRSMVDQIDATIAALQRLVSELRPAVLDDLGLVAAIEWQCQDFQKRTGVPCACVTSADEIDMDAGRATALFRICQEALTNVARHAQATATTVTLEGRDGAVRLVVADNGRGIPAHKVADRQSLGVLGMRERVSQCGGELSIQGEPGKGTVVTVQLPRQGSIA